MSRPKTILIKRAEFILTMNRKGEILRNESLLIKNNRIDKIGNIDKIKADEVIDACGKIVIPGFINCHHHMFQTGLRGAPELQNQRIDKWINFVSKYAANLSDEAVYYSALINMAELLLYGCTTTTDMLYIFPKRRNFFETTIKAASDIGIRFHPYRGSMSLSKKDGSLYPDGVVERSEDIAMHSESVIRKYHNTDSLAMIRIGLAPCTIFTNKKQDYQSAILLSKKYHVNVQTHLSESEFENTYSIKKFDKRPLQYLADLGWRGKRVSFVHAINLNKEELEFISRQKANIVHCPISNARGSVGESGIAPIREMLGKKINVAAGVDGSAGNDSSNVLEELRWARVLQGTRKEETYLNPKEVFKIGTINGARLLNWEKQLGSIKEGKAADLAIFNIGNKVEYASGENSPYLLLSCQAVRAETVIVNGKIVVKDGKLVKFIEKDIISKFNKEIKKTFN